VTHRSSSLPRTHLRGDTSFQSRRLRALGFDPASIARGRFGSHLRTIFGDSMDDADLRAGFARKRARAPKAKCPHTRPNALNGARTRTSVPRHVSSEEEMCVRATLPVKGPPSSPHPNHKDRDPHTAGIWMRGHASETTIRSSGSLTCVCGQTNL
jgi:hypothetical protein